MLMYKIFFLFGFFLSSSFAFAQNKGNLTINTDKDDYDALYRGTPVKILLLKNDSIISSDEQFSLGSNTSRTFDSLVQGYYHFKILIRDTLFCSFPNLYVKGNANNQYRFRFSSYQTKMGNQVCSFDTTDSEYIKGEITFGGLYGNNAANQSNQLLQNEQYSGELAINGNHPLTKYYSIGLKFGAQYSQTGFFNDTTHINGLKTLSKYYSYFDINAGFFNRFTFFNNKPYSKDGLKLDIGINYHFPIFFKQVLKVNDDTKTITRHIHNYSDFTAMVRFGYKYVGLQAEYSLTNFLRQSYTESPKLRLGLVFYIPY